VRCAQQGPWLIRGNSQRSDLAVAHIGRIVFWLGNENDTRGSERMRVRMVHTSTTVKREFIRSEEEEGETKIQYTHKGEYLSSSAAKRTPDRHPINS
jgi:hypothetical protein